MSIFRAFPQSPLARHPTLLARKIAGRLGLRRENAALPKAAVTPAVYPGHWAPALRSWIREVPLRPAPHPFNRVFGHDFGESFLLQLCRKGPRLGERGLAGDIKLIWDYSRGQPLFTNAAAGPAHLDTCVAFVDRWLAHNGDTNGPAWTCPMEVAIRGVNWIFADVLFAQELGRRVGTAEWAAWLWRHGYLVRQRLEARLVSSNHYLADLLGLFIIGAVFPEDPAARAWLRFAQGEFPRALLAQTRRDGGLNEASLPYHAYATEMALLFRLALGSAFPAAAEARLHDMCRIVADFCDTTGDVFAIGDDDSGRVLALDVASPSGRVEILLRLASSLLGEDFKTSAGAVCLESGWWVRRAGEFAVALDFGGVGLRGLGAHAHNDDFSFCLEWRGHPVITDPGTFLYTGDAEARNRFRSTVFHNTLMVDGREQRELSDSVFGLHGADAAYKAERQGDDAWAFTRSVAPGIVHRREVSVTDGLVLISDIVEGSGRHHLEWRFHLHPSIRPDVSRKGFALVISEAGILLLEAAGLPTVLDIVPAEYSSGYGRSCPARACRVQGEFSLPVSMEWRFRHFDA